MPIQSCRGPERKAEIYRLYDLEIGTYCKITNHQSGENIRNECCGVALEEEFVQFFYEPKRDAALVFSPEFPPEHGSFFVGKYCADQLIELMKADDPGIRLPPRFNPEINLAPRPRRQGHPGGGGRDGLRIEQPAQPTELNEEVRLVINLIATICRTPLTARLNRMVQWLRIHPDTDTADWAVMDINDAVARHPEMRDRTLRQAMTDEEAVGRDPWRQFGFPNIERILRADGIQSFIDPQADLPDQPPLRRWATVTREVRGGHMVEIEDDGSEAVLFADVAGQAGVAPITIGDLFCVRLGEFPRGPRVRKIYEEMERAVIASIKFVDPHGNFAFLSRDGERDIFVPTAIYRGDLGSAERGAVVSVRFREGLRGPQATWASLVPD